MCAATRLHGHVNSCARLSAVRLYRRAAALGSCDVMKAGLNANISAALLLLLCMHRARIDASCIFEINQRCFTSCARAHMSTAERCFAPRTVPADPGPHSQSTPGYFLFRELDISPDIFLAAAAERWANAPLSLLCFSKGSPFSLEYASEPTSSPASYESMVSLPLRNS